MTPQKNEIVVYQPNDIMRIEVRFEDETVWLKQSQMAELFGCTVRNVRTHLANIYSCGELDEDSTRKDFFLVRMEGTRITGAEGGVLQCSAQGPVWASVP